MYNIINYCSYLSSFSLRALGGDVVRFVDSGQGASWCGSTGQTCYSCSAHALNTPTDRTCAARLMTARLASAVTHLAEMVAVEWPDSKWSINWTLVCVLIRQPVWPSGQALQAGKQKDLGSGAGIAQWLERRTRD